MTDWQKTHDDLTREYYLEGNPNKLTPGLFLLAHDAIWIEKDLEEGRIAQDRADELSQDVATRAKALSNVVGN